MAIGGEMANVTVGGYHCCPKHMSIVLSGQCGAEYKQSDLKDTRRFKAKREVLARTVILGNILRNC